MFFLATFPFFNSSFAADIQLTLSHYSRDNNVHLIVENNSLDGVKIDCISVELDGRKYEHKFRSVIASNNKKEFSYRIKYPSLPGSYPLTATVSYYNENNLLSLKHVALFNYMEPAGLDDSCFAENVAFHDEGSIIVKSARSSLYRLILPDEIEIVSVSTFPKKRVFHVKTKLTGLRTSYTYFAVAEDIFNGKHHAAICSALLRTGTADTAAVSGDRGRVSSGLLAVQILLFLSISIYVMTAQKKANRFFACLGKYSCRMFYVTFFYFCLKNIGFWLGSFIPLVSFAPAQHLLSIIRDNFSGPNYNYFFKYFVDYYWGACLVLTFPYLYYFDSDKTPGQDKYFCSLKSVLSIFSLLKGKKPFWNSRSRLGMLTIGVKLFYIPYLTSWVINNTFHQSNLIGSFVWDIYTINSFLVALFIYVDTIIYSFGYVVESKYLKNTIKTVEPTILGWAVCLWCYPPFNVFSFRLFDHQIADISHAYPFWVNVSMTCVISFLWAVFAWASVALGFKASNLTNRGIVASGPYRFCRHPAYVAKLIIWLIQGIFFSRFSTGILLGFILIYFLRAWTEERHLSLDPDYITYKKKVPWRFVPGVF